MMKESLYLANGGHHHYISSCRLHLTKRAQGTAHLLLLLLLLPQAQSLCTSDHLRPYQLSTLQPLTPDSQVILAKPEWL